MWVGLAHFPTLSLRWLTYIYWRTVTPFDPKNEKKNKWWITLFMVGWWYTTMWQEGIQAPPTPLILNFIYVMYRHLCYGYYYYIIMIITLATRKAITCGLLIWMILYNIKFKNIKCWYWTTISLVVELSELVIMWLNKITSTTICDHMLSTGIISITLGTCIIRSVLLTKTCTLQFQLNRFIMDNEYGYLTPGMSHIHMDEGIIRAVSPECPKFHKTMLSIVMSQVAGVCNSRQQTDHCTTPKHEANNEKKSEGDRRRGNTHHFNSLSYLKIIIGCTTKYKIK